MKRSTVGWVLAAALLSTAVLQSCGGDDDDVFFADLEGSQEVPPVSTDAEGAGFFKLRNGETEIEFLLEQGGLQSVLFAHIHVGPPGVNGPIIFNLATAPFTEVSGTLTAADLIPNPGQGIRNFADAVAAIKSGNTYANIHTQAFPGGEIRGQIGED